MNAHRHPVLTGLDPSTVLETSARLLETRVHKAGGLIGSVLDIGLREASEVGVLLEALSDLDVPVHLRGSREAGATFTRTAYDDGVEAIELLRDLVHSTTQVRAACREVEQTSVSTRLLTLQTRIEGVRLDERTYAASTAEQVNALNLELSEVTVRMRGLLDELDRTLEGLLETERAMKPAVGGFHDALINHIDDVCTRAAVASRRLEETAEQVSQRNDELLTRSRRVLSELQFQDPLTQELRAIRAGLLGPRPDLDSAWARTDAVVEAARAPLGRAGDELSKIESDSQTTNLWATNAATQLLEESMASVVSDAERSITSHLRRLSRLAGSKADLASTADEICHTLQESELAIRRVADQTRLVAANAAIKAARVGGSGRATSVIAGELSLLNAVVCKATDRVRTGVGDLVERLPGLTVEATTVKERTAALDHIVRTAFTTCQGLLDEAESALLDGLSSTPSTSRDIQRLTREALQHLQLEDELEDEVSTVLEQLVDLGAVPGGTASEASINAIPDDHPVAAGELLLF